MEMFPGACVIKLLTVVIYSHLTLKTCVMVNFDYGHVTILRRSLSFFSIPLNENLMVWTTKKLMLWTMEKRKYFDHDDFSIATVA